jgi:tRNA nucleotidyltransferase (CCA-adding enzyme)
MYALEALWQRVQEQIAAANAFSLKDLAIDGNDVMRELGIPQGPQVGQILSALFERVLDEPELNTREKLLELARAMKP